VPPANGIYKITKLVVDDLSVTAFKQNTDNYSSSFLISLKNALSTNDLVQIIESIKVLYFKLQLQAGRSDKTFDKLIEIASDCDCFPTGPERKFWNKDALKRSDLKMSKYYGDTPTVIKDLMPEIEKLLNRRKKHDRPEL